MAIKDGKDYLYLIWKCSSNRRQYIVGQLTKNGQYELRWRDATGKERREEKRMISTLPQ